MNKLPRCQHRTSFFLASWLGFNSLLISQSPVAAATDFAEPGSVAGLSVRMQGEKTILAWPSHPRESFVVLWRPAVSVEARWIELTNHLRASPSTNQTSFHDQTASSRGATTVADADPAEFYRVFLIPDFWFDMEGVELRGGPNRGEDFLPFFSGTKESWELFKPHVSLRVDGEGEFRTEISTVDFGAEESVERINFGTHRKPEWVYSRGLWFQHDTLPNGDHALQLAAQLTLNNMVGEASQYLTLTNRPVRVRVRNEIYFPDSQPFIHGDTYTYSARSVTPRVNWRIDVYDQRGQPVASKTGRTSNGEIRWTWDLRDKHGRLRDDFDRDQIFPSTVTTWPMGEEVKGAQALLSMKDEHVSVWWSDRLGRDFVRKPPSEQERRLRFIYLEPLPFESQALTRPLELFGSDSLR